MTISSVISIQSTNVTDGQTPVDSKDRACALRRAVKTTQYTPNASQTCVQVEHCEHVPSRNYNNDGLLNVCTSDPLYLQSMFLLRRVALEKLLSEVEA